MSNPAVTKLVRDVMGGLSFWMDDNIGETIHIHLADLRLDLTVQELYNLSDELADTINEMVNVENFDIRKIDPVYFQTALCHYLPYLERVEIENVHLEDLLVSWKRKNQFVKYAKIKDSRGFKALNGDTKENDRPRKSHHVGQSSAERLEEMRKSVEANGYPYDGKYIICFDDKMLIKDGQHRASCLYYLYGNIEVPIMRLYFSDPAVSIYYLNPLMQFYILKRQIKFYDGEYFGIARRLAINALHKCKSLKGKLYLMLHKSLQKTTEEIYFESKGYLK